MTNAEARCNKSLRPRKPEGSLGRTAQDVHLDSHTAPELCWLVPALLRKDRRDRQSPPEQECLTSSSVRKDYHGRGSAILRRPQSLSRDVYNNSYQAAPPSAQPPVSGQRYAKGQSAGQPGRGGKQGNK